MGITYNNASMLLQAKLNGTTFGKTLTIGNLTLYLSKYQIQKLSRKINQPIDSSLFSKKQYSENFFKHLLGATEVKSLDCSGYQSCDVVHDMNTPISQDLYEKYDTIVDGGTLEHIYNIPTAIMNYMNLVGVGGNVFIFTMANNHMGHGFYQFSPEFFFRTFQPEYGFEIVDVIMEKHPFPGAELSENTKCYVVNDPVNVGGRVGLISNSPAMIMVHAKKLKHLSSVFLKYPIQSDYAKAHTKHRDNAEGNQSTNGHTIKNTLKKIYHFCTPKKLKNYIKGKRQVYRFSYSNKKFYKKWNPL